MRFPLRAALVAAMTLAATGTALAQEPALPTSSCPPMAIDDGHSVSCDAWTSPNVSYLGTIQQDVGLTTGGRVVPSTPEMKKAGIPDRLFVHNAKNFSIYDISDPANPVTMGTIHFNVAWEGEEIPTDGKVVVLADAYLIADPMCGAPGVGLVQSGKGCLQFYDVRDPSNVREVGAIPAQNHTAECAAPAADKTNDCEYVYGSYGTIVDARGVLDGKEPTVIGDWIQSLKAEGVSESSCHHIRQLRPGVLLTACKPFSVISINAEDGGSPAHPAVLATGKAPGGRFIHSARWPRGGTDKFIFSGGENNFTGVCSDNQSTFDVYNANQVVNGESKDFGKPTDELAPTNGTYTDGHAPAGELGCSTHWFMEHPTFHNGGLVALSQYENGVRFLQVTPAGKIKEVGYFVATGSSSSSPKWAPDGRTVYSMDYHRGIDILRYNGDTYVPNAKGKVVHEPGKVRGTSAHTPAAARNAALVGEVQLLQQLHSVGWFPGYCQLQAEKYGNAR